MKYTKTALAICLIISILSSFTSCFLIPEQEQEEHAHKAGSEWISNSKFHWHECVGEDCTMIANKEEHKFDNGIVTKPPTKNETGVTTFTCSVCGYSKDETMAKYDHEHRFDAIGQCACGNGFVKEIYDDNGYKLNYNVYTPLYASEENKRPLVIFLHGAGERGSDNQSQLKNAILKAAKGGEWANSVIIAPQCPSSTGGNTNSDVNDPNKWVETNWTKGNYIQANVPESKPMHALAELIKEYIAYDYVDADRVYVVGLSMGGFGTWDLISRYPELFAAAAPICGGGPIDKIDVLKNIPIYTFHGSSDNAVPYSGTQEMFNAITAIGGDKILFHTFSGAGHAIWDQAITFGGNNVLPSLESWLFNQRAEKNHPADHVYTNWIVTTHPTYEEVGEIRAYCDYCSNCKTAELPLVSEANGYTKISSGASTVWKYTYEGKDYEFIVDSTNTYTFDVSDEDDVFSGIVDNNGRDANGRLTNKKHTDAAFYELTQGASFTVDLNASEDAEATFIVKLLGSGSYSYKDLFRSIYVTNGENTTEATINNGQAELIGWYITQNHTVKVELANVSLKEGKNSITFTMGDINVNIAGIDVVTAAKITHEPVRTEYGYSMKDYDPFASENGGSVTTNGSATQKVNNDYGVFYMNNQKSTFTFTVYADKATDVVLCMSLAFSNTNGYATNSIVTAISSADADGQTNTVTLVDAVTVKNNSWNYIHALKADFAVISLKEGVNTITFTFGENDVNITGVYLKSNNEIVFGTKNNSAE